MTIQQGDLQIEALQEEGKSFADWAATIAAAEPLLLIDAPLDVPQWANLAALDGDAPASGNEKIPAPVAAIGEEVFPQYNAGAGIRTKPFSFDDDTQLEGISPADARGCARCRSFD